MGLNLHPTEWVRMVSNLGRISVGLPGLVDIEIGEGGDYMKKANDGQT